MTAQNRLEESIRTFIVGCKKKFRLPDLLEYLRSQDVLTDSEKPILDLLESMGLVFSTDFLQFHPRHLFFKNAQFLISPTEEELTNGYLIPGHRFHPFINPRIKPWEAVLIDFSQQPVPTCTIQKRVRDLYIFHSLFSRTNPFNLHEKSSVLSDNNHMVELTAFDLSDRYKRWRLRPGAGILLTVKDWDLGKYEASPISKRKRQALLKSSSEWLRILERGFQRSFEDLGLKYPIEEQIAYAYYHAGKKILTNPPIHLGGFIESSSLVNFVDVGTENRLWFSPHIPAQEVEIPNIPEPSEQTGTIETILLETGVAIDESSVEAYIRDALYHGNTSQEQVLERIFTGRNKIFHTTEQRDSFISYFQNLWKRVKRSYNSYTDRNTGAIRKQILQILDEQIAWIRSLDSRSIETKDLPLEEFSSAAKLSNFLENFLKLLNSKNPGTEAELADSLALLPEIQKSMQEIQQNVESALTKKTKPKKKQDSLAQSSSPPRRKKKGSTGSGLENPKPKKLTPTSDYYVLKVQLQYIRPQIWRRLQIPGFYTLQDLHTTIQIGMGWANYHLHAFQIHNKYYGSPEAEVEYMIPDSSITLDSLNLQLKQRLHYTYDFGDNWEHTILVEKILALNEVPEPQRNRSVCTGGRRACPPEDCGGFGGYEDILVALSSPNKKRHRELLEWVGSYNPEHFDLEQVNELLAAEFNV